MNEFIEKDRTPDEFVPNSAELSPELKKLLADCFKFYPDERASALDVVGVLKSLLDNSVIE